MVRRHGRLSGAGRAVKRVAETLRPNSSSVSPTGSISPAHPLQQVLPPAHWPVPDLDSGGNREPTLNARLVRSVTGPSLSMPRRKDDAVSRAAHVSTSTRERGSVRPSVARRNPQVGDGVSAVPRVQLASAGRLVDCRLYGDRSGAVRRNAQRWILRATTREATQWGTAVQPVRPARFGGVMSLDVV